MFPVSDVIPPRTVPFVTIGVIVLNTLTFLYEWRLDAHELQRLVDAQGVVPADFSWPTVLTGMFLHAGWLHFAGDMLYLRIFGENVEDRLGHAAYGLLYVCCGGVAALGHVAANPHSTVPMIGASGAVAGVVAAYLVLYPQARVLTAVVVVFYFDLIEVPAIYFLGIWVLMQLFIGLGSLEADSAAGVAAFGAQIAGFGVGAVGGAMARVATARPWL